MEHFLALFARHGISAGRDRLCGGDRRSVPAALACSRAERRVPCA